MEEAGHHLEVEEDEFVGSEEEEDDFCSCCTQDQEDQDECDEEEEEEEDMEDCLKMFFKGVSIVDPQSGDSSGSGLSGIGVVIEKSPGIGEIGLQVQKKLDLYVDQLVAEYLAFMDGLQHALNNNNTRRIMAFTDNNALYHQITHEEKLDNQLVKALRDRILEHASEFEFFAVKLVPTIELQRPLQLAQIAIGIVCLTASEEGSLEDCPICCEAKLPSMMINMKCAHKFCSHCMRTYVEGKVQTSQVPIRCPQLRCKYYISSRECRSFLPVTCYNLLERALLEANIHDSEKLYCPFPSCSVLLNPRQCLSTRESSSSNSDNSCVECPECQRFVCLDCGVPWHSSMSCEEYQSLPIEERDAGDITLHRLAQNKKWRRCQQCRRMIELTQGCYHMTCWCGHEFCYSCGAEYGDGQQTCQCAFWDEENLELPASQVNHEAGQWRWDSLDSLPTIMDAYSDQERSQLALIQRFLAGGFGLSDHQPYQSSPRCSDSYIDTLKELHQLPWLERFVSVISDNYYEDYTQ